MKWFAVCALTAIAIAIVFADGEVWEEDDHEVLIRSERGAKNRGETLILVYNCISIFASISRRILN